MPAMTLSLRQPRATLRLCASLSSTRSTTLRWQRYGTAPNGSTPASTTLATHSAATPPRSRTVQPKVEALVRCGSSTRLKRAPQSFVRVAVAWRRTVVAPRGGGAYERWDGNAGVEDVVGVVCGFDPAQPRQGGGRVCVREAGGVAVGFKAEIHSEAAELGPGLLGVGAARFVDGRGQGEVLGAVGVCGGVGGCGVYRGADRADLEHVDIAVSEQATNGGRAACVEVI